MTFTDFGKIAESKNQVVKFIHVATGTSVTFPAFITEYSDAYAVNWGDEMIFGRNDPIKPYQSTTRSISLAFDVLSPNMQKAKDNLAKYTTLTKMLYPVYTPALNSGIQSLGRTIKAPPLIRLKFVNMVQSADGNGSLLGCISGFSYQPNRDAGFFVEGGGDLFPKHFNISFTFIPQHENPLGWDSSTGQFLTDNFPYAAGIVTTNDQKQGDNASVQRANQQKLLNN